MHGKVKFEIIRGREGLYLYLEDTLIAGKKVNSEDVLEGQILESFEVPKKIIRDLLKYTKE